MKNALELVNLTPDSAPPGLERVCATPPQKLNLAEQVAIRQAFSIDNRIDYVFFRRFTDGRTSHVAAYVVDNADGRFNQESLAELHRQLWLSGSAPLLYVGWQDHVDVLTCAAGSDFLKNGRQVYSPIAQPYKQAELISDVLEAQKNVRFSAFRLHDGTFWDDPRNAKLANADKSAHRTLIDKVKNADEQLGGAENPLVRRLLLVVLLIKYLEDRKVFPKIAGSWFSRFHAKARSFLDILEHAPAHEVLRMFRILEERFNGGIFALPNDGKDLTDKMLRQLAQVVTDNSDLSGQMHFWALYSFEHIPVEVLSQLYQHFAQTGTGSVFTPTLLVNLLLDQVMPLDGTLRGDETVFDPTCGSGVFLVAAFRRHVAAWSARNNWRRPEVDELKDLLSKTIFGVELQPESAYLGAFSLALAICDALQPEIIWDKLRFNKLDGQNIFSGNFFEQAKHAKEMCGDGGGFDVIVGNPPFLSKKKKAKGEDSSDDIESPDQQLAYKIFLDCVKCYLRPGGQFCMIQPAGFLYNEGTRSFRQTFFAETQIEAILDFVSIRGVFEGANPTIIALHGTKIEPPGSHVVKHVTFRRTISANEKILFELDYYDYHAVAQSLISEAIEPWGANLLGGGRLYHLVKTLKSFPTLKDYVKSRKWTSGEGFIVGNRKNETLSLHGMNLLPTKSLTLKTESIDDITLKTVEETHFEAPRRPEQRFKQPMFLIKENDGFPCVFSNIDVAYKHRIVGICAPKKDSLALQIFATEFRRMRDVLVACCYLLGAKSFVSRQGLVEKQEIEALPYPENGKWNLVPWEKELLGDVGDYMASYVHSGQASELLKKKVDQKAMDTYRNTFMRLMKPVYKNIYACGSDSREGLSFQAFNFGLNSIDPPAWLKGDWLAHMRSTVFTQHGEALCTSRVIRFYDQDTLIMVKPDRLRYWIRSTAIRDVDGTLLEVVRGKEQA